METPIFPQSWGGEYPPEIAKLIRLYNGVIGAAERAAGLSIGLFSKIKTGRHSYTEYIHQRVLEALKHDPMQPNQEKPMSAKLTIHDKCPPILADLIRFKGSKARAWPVIGSSEGTFYKVISGRGEMPAAWEIKAKAAMGRSVIAEAPAPATPAGPPIPEFVPWDGKSKGTLEIQGFGQNKGRKVKGVPQPLLDLVAKNGGIVANASRALGMSSTSLQNWFKPAFTFTELKQRKVHAAIHGQIPPSGPSMGEEFDKYTLGIAICMLKGASFDHIAGLAEVLMAQMVFRKNTAKGWIIIYRMADEDLPKFKRLALRDAEEIVCP